MPQVSFVSGGLFLICTVFAMLTWLTGRPWYLISPRNDISRTTPLLYYWIFWCSHYVAANTAKIHNWVHSKCSDSPNKAGLLRQIWYEGLVFLTLALDPSDQGRCEGETVANDQHQSFTRTLCHCEARPTPQRPQRVLKGNLLGRFLRSRGIRKWPSKWQLNWCQFIKPWALGMSRTVSGSNCLQRTKLLVPLTLGVELPKWWIKDLLTQPHGSFFKKIEWHYAAVGMFGIGFLGWLTSKSPCWLSKVLRNDTYIHIKYDIDIQVMISNTQKHHIYSYIYYTYTCMRVVVQKVHFEAANSNEKNASQATFISSSVSWKWKTSASSASSKASPLPDPIHPGNVHSQASSCQLIK